MAVTAIEKPCFTNRNHCGEHGGGALLGISCRHRKAYGRFVCPSRKLDGSRGRENIVPPEMKKKI